jgi:hypothetical protein
LQLGNLANQRLKIFNVGIWPSATGNLQLVRLAIGDWKFATCEIGHRQLEICNLGIWPSATGNLQLGNLANRQLAIANRQ